jgi:nucleoside 2-deoxyribosyltransferase
MLALTEIVFLAAPFTRPEEIAFNRRLAEVVRAYNFPLFMPQEARDELRTGELPEQAISVDAVLAPAVSNSTNADERLAEVCMEALHRANLVISVFYGDDFDSRTAFEVGYALGRRINVVAVQNTRISGPERSEQCAPWSGPNLCSRVVVAPHEEERFPDRLIPILNRYFEPFKPLR